MGQANSEFDTAKQNYESSVKAVQEFKPDFKTRKNKFGFDPESLLTDKYSPEKSLTEAKTRIESKGDFASALKEWQPLADKGVAEAQYNLGLLHAKGQGVPQDSAQAVKWYRKAADQGFVEAEFNLGLMYSGGEGVPKDSSEAMKWFLKAAGKGDAKAADTVGSFFEAEGTFKNYAEAEKWYRKAAEQGVASAQFNLGAMYDIGQGVKVDFAEAE